ncbi:MAG: GntR family transcriptional regulator [Pseudoclavibacter sp.]
MGSFPSILCCDGALTIVRFVPSRPSFIAVTPLSVAAACFMTPTVRQSEHTSVDTARKNRQKSKMTTKSRIVTYAGLVTATTLTQQVLTDLRADILAGKFEPGSKVRLGEISSRFGVSMSVVREAMTRLAEQNLVEALPQRGFRIMPLSVEDLRDLTRARVLLESMVLRESIERGDLDWEASVVASLHKLQAVPFLESDRRVSYDWVRAHSNFHRVLMAGSGNARLASIAMNLRDCSELYRHWSRELAGDVGRDIRGEHNELAELTVARDPRAVAALAAHIERTSTALVDGLSIESGSSTE